MLQKVPNCAPADDCLGTYRRVIVRRTGDRLIANMNEWYTSYRYHTDLIICGALRLSNSVPPIWGLSVHPGWWANARSISRSVTATSEHGHDLVFNINPGQGVIKDGACPGKTSSFSENQLEALQHAECYDTATFTAGGLAGWALT